MSYPTNQSQNESTLLGEQVNAWTHTHTLISKIVKEEERRFGAGIGLLVAILSYFGAKAD